MPGARKLNQKKKQQTKQKNPNKNPNPSKQLRGKKKGDITFTPQSLECSPGFSEAAALHAMFREKQTPEACIHSKQHNVQMLPSGNP